MNELQGSPRDRLAPLFAPWEIPDKHRAKAPSPDMPAVIIPRRRPSGFTVVNLLRQELAGWRDQDYYSASDTSRELLHHWFGNDHLQTGPDGQAAAFRYYFCQREAIETLVFLHEVKGLRCLTDVLGEYGHEDEDERIQRGLGVAPDQNRWPRYAFKIATGAGKTKIMSLAVVWSYFHALRESDSPLARNFVVIAPNLTVFERLKLDFANGRIFYQDPLIPPAWQGDWHLTTVLQDEASGAAAGATLYLTNIHRLYDPERRRTSQEDELYAWAGPSVSKATALEVGEELRTRIASHGRVMVLNDEAHHVWDPRSAWNEAIEHLHGDASVGRVCAQLDFSATPKDQRGQPFQHIIVESALGEAVDAGIVKTPVIGRGKGLTVDETAEDASDKYLQHLMIGYERWKLSLAEWQGSGKTPLMFVMCEDTNAADQITRRLNTDARFDLLNSRTANLHTNLKGRVVKRGRNPNHYYEFVESESQIKDEDLAKLRQLAQELDKDTSPYRCIVSVLMLREGWDVKNVTTIVPLRPLTADSKILPEQTLGRGLRRMTPPVGGAHETVVVVEHEAFVAMMQEALAGEGVEPVIEDVEKIERHTVTIYPDTVKKDAEALEVMLPSLSPAHEIVLDLKALELDAVRRRFDELGLEPLQLGDPQPSVIDYEEHTLFTAERLQAMQIPVSLLKSAITAPSYFRHELEVALNLRGLLTDILPLPLIKRFLCEVLFTEQVAATDQRLGSALNKPEVKEYVRAVFAPLVREITTKTVARQPAEPVKVSAWQPFQVTSSPNKPTIPADRTIFNLVTCDRNLERQFAEFLDDRAGDVAAFAKNAGPQALRIDYLAAGQRLAFYCPDFFVRLADGQYLLVETKGRVDQDVPLKARAAVAWCQSACRKGQPSWRYVYLQEARFKGYSGGSMEGLAAATAPDLQALLDEANVQQLALPFDGQDTDEQAAAVEKVITARDLARLPATWRTAIDEAVSLLRFTHEKKASLGPAFQPLLPRLDEGARSLITAKLRPHLPTQRLDQDRFFEPIELDNLANGRLRIELDKHQKNLRRSLLYGTKLIMPLGVLAFCLDYAAQTSPAVGTGVFGAIHQEFATVAGTDLPDLLAKVKDFRNDHVAHAEQDITDFAAAEAMMGTWVQALQRLAGAVV